MFMHISITILKFFSVDVDLDRFEEHLKSLKGNANRKIFRRGQQIVDNTYGGKTFSELDEFLKLHVCEQGSLENQQKALTAIVHCKSGFMVVNLHVYI